VGPPCSRTGEDDLHGDPSSNNTSGGTESGKDGDGVAALLEDDEEPSLEGERECLVPLLSSIVAKRRRREENPKGKE
jgi:hypothetical protein